MVCSHLRKLLAFVFLLCLLTFLPEKVDGARDIEAPHNLKEVEVVGINSRKGSEALSSSFDLNRTSKRRVRRGSDPIHNRC
ncbi:hypothetical protein KSP39_PZI015129 [Platanthera zijinensis]|uniref:Uncharacterized protein n=1 Tax=Platanthera zijinensis TaxID=2320716 RepID=A0AAP0BAW8_9ASPA